MEREERGRAQRGRGDYCRVRILDTDEEIDRSRPTRTRGWRCGNHWVSGATSQDLVVSDEQDTSRSPITRRSTGSATPGCCGDAALPRMPTNAADPEPRVLESAARFLQLKRRHPCARRVQVFECMVKEKPAGRTRETTVVNITHVRTPKVRKHRRSSRDGDRRAKSTSPMSVDGGSSCSASAAGRISPRRELRSRLSARRASRSPLQRRRRSFAAYVSRSPSVQPATTTLTKVKEEDRPEQAECLPRSEVRTTVCPTRAPYLIPKPPSRPPPVALLQQRSRRARLLDEHQSGKSEVPSSGELTERLRPGKVRRLSVPSPSSSVTRRTCACPRRCQVPCFGTDTVCDFCVVESHPQPPCDCDSAGHTCCMAEEPTREMRGDVTHCE